MEKVTISLILCLFSGLAFGEVIAPSPDISEASDPTITGTIKSVNRNVIEIVSEKGTVSILTDKSTRFFTEFGGRVLFSQLCISEKIEVWYEEKAPAIAVRVPKKCM